VAELPELTILARQMHESLSGKVVAGVETLQPKCLNLPADEFQHVLLGRTIEAVESRGKWLFARLRPSDYLLLSTGMGANLLYYEAGAELPGKYQLRLHMADDSGFTVRFWWFGYVHYVRERELTEHRLTAGMGLSPLDPAFTTEHLAGLLQTRRAIKAVLMDQRSVAGVGNVYIQDTLFRARLHPLRPSNSLSAEEVVGLHHALRGVLNRGLSLRGLAYERDFYGRPGGLANDDFEVGYREGKPCPRCGTTIEKIKTGSTASYICPRCQVL